MVCDLCTGVSRDTRQIISMVPPMRQLHLECDPAWGSQQSHPQSLVKEPGQAPPCRGTPPVSMNRYCVCAVGATVPGMKIPVCITSAALAGITA